MSMPHRPAPYDSSATSAEPAADPMSSLDFALPPAPPSERGAWLLACAIAAVGVAVLVAVLSGVVGQTRTVAPPPVLASVSASTPVAPVSPAAARAVVHAHAAILAQPSAAQQSVDARRFVADDTQTHIDRSWMEGFYPIYETAQKTFGVNWLLIASIHRQETAFSTAPSTYHGLNFAHCCGGPMQFNVTNGGAGIPSTWNLVSNSYTYGKRPAYYEHMTSTHPSIYDDFDAIMAAAHLLSADGAGYALDDSAWVAAYDYYGHDATGVTYADQVLARAIGWSQHGFCINCGVEPALEQAINAAYGAPVLAGLTEAETKEVEAKEAEAKAKEAKAKDAKDAEAKETPTKAKVKKSLDGLAKATKRGGASRP